MTIRRFVSRLAIAGAAMTLSAGTAGADELRPFEAHYNVIWKGIGAGRSSITLKRLDNGRWTYESRNIARGLFRIALPGDISQTSEFRVVDDAVIPEHFRGDDGTSSTRKDVDIRFDWQARHATGTAEDKKIEVALDPGVQDGMSVQAALMLELMRGRTPSSFQMIDKDRVKEYLYTREGTETLETALGRKETVIFRSRRPDSEYSTMFWCAPDLGYVPIKVERHHGAKIEWSMVVQSVTRE
ncbi:MAG TPA: DUF3108 domain-containing protein [Steroidobacteraceae bacterium]|jgi:hypothetical protein|nr:DUF3108 domain-containing protein [Steroidobacteraceae bacterium]